MTQGSFMKRRRFDQVARFYEGDPQYDQAAIDVKQAITMLSSTNTRDPSRHAPMAESSSVSAPVPVPVLD
jgi:hypothetical protein